LVLAGSAEIGCARGAGDAGPMSTVWMAVDLVPADPSALGPRGSEPRLGCPKVSDPQWGRPNGLGMRVVTLMASGVEVFGPLTGRQEGVGNRAVALVVLGSELLDPTPLGLELLGLSTPGLELLGLPILDLELLGPPSLVLEVLRLWGLSLWIVVFAVSGLGMPSLLSRGWLLGRVEGLGLQAVGLMGWGLAVLGLVVLGPLSACSEALGLLGEVPMMSGQRMAGWGAVVSTMSVL